MRSCHKRWNKSEAWRRNLEEKPACHPLQTTCEHSQSNKEKPTREHQAELLHHFNVIQPHIRNDDKHRILVVLLQLLELRRGLHRGGRRAAKEVYVAIVRPGKEEDVWADRRSTFTHRYAVRMCLLAVLLIHWPCGWGRFCWWKSKTVDMENRVLVPAWRDERKPRSSLGEHGPIILMHLNFNQLHDP